MTSAAELTAARLRRPGPNGARVLLIAGRSWLAATRSPDEHRVPVRLLDRVWLTARRGIELDVVCGPGRVLRLLESFAGAWDLAQYDAVVLLADPGRPHVSGRSARELDRIADVVPVLSVSTGALRRPVDAAPAAAQGPGLQRLHVDVPADACPAATVAEAVAAALAGVLDPLGRAGLPEQRAPRLPHLQRIVSMTAAAFAVEAAAIALLGSGPARTLAAVGPELHHGECFAEGPVRSRVVLDTWSHADLVRDERMRRGSGIRFFATEAILTRAGRTIGALTVADPMPRSAGEFDGRTLRDLAVLAAAEIQYAAASV